MKMKNIFAFGVAAMMLSTTAFAATAPTMDTNFGGIITVIETPYTKAEVMDRTVDIDLSVKAIKASEAQANGVNLGTGMFAKTDDNCDFYEMKLNVTNIGDLYRAYNEESVMNNGGTAGAEEHSVVLYSVDIEIPGVQLKGNATTATSFGKAWEALGTSAAGFNLRWISGSSAATYVPVNVNNTDIGMDVGNMILNASTGEVTWYLVTANKTEDLTITPKLNSVALYTDNASSAVTKANWVNGQTLTFAADKAAAADPVEFSAALAEDTDFGYIWALTFTKSADKLASFTAKFEADGVEPAERTVANASAIATALAGKSAPVVLNVGLSTTKTLTKATFTADDADDTTDACVVVAPLSK